MNQCTSMPPRTPRTDRNVRVRCLNTCTHTGRTLHKTSLINVASRAQVREWNNPVCTVSPNLYYINTMLTHWPEFNQWPHRVPSKSNDSLLAHTLTQKSSTHSNDSFPTKTPHSQHKIK